MKHALYSLAALVLFSGCTATVPQQPACDESNPTATHSVYGCVKAAPLVWQQAVKSCGPAIQKMSAQVYWGLRKDPLNNGKSDEELTWALQQLCGQKM